MKKFLLLATLSFLSANCLAQDQFVNATSQCMINPQTMPHSRHSTYDFASDHGVSVTNTSGVAQAYIIQYTGLTRQTDMGLMPVTMKKHTITIGPGQTFNETYHLMGKTGFGQKGTFLSAAFTEIFNAHGKIVVPRCIQYSTVKAT